MSGVSQTRRLAAAVALGSTLGLAAGCADLDKLKKQQLGTGVGAAAGGAIGSQIGSGRGKIIATVVGLAAGALIGNRIGAYLDEQDQRRAAEAARLATITGRPQTWQNPETGVSGRAEVVDTETTRQAVAVPILKARVQEVPPL